MLTNGMVTGMLLITVTKVYSHPALAPAHTLARHGAPRASARTPPRPGPRAVAGPCGPATTHGSGAGPAGQDNYARRQRPGPRGGAPPKKHNTNGRRHRPGRSPSRPPVVPGMQQRGALPWREVTHTQGPKDSRCPAGPLRRPHAGCAETSTFGPNVRLPCAKAYTKPALSNARPNFRVRPEALEAQKHGTKRRFSGRADTRGNSPGTRRGRFCHQALHGIAVRARGPV